jgi:hypothetical protein
MGAKLGLKLKEESRQKEFENRILRKIFGCKEQEITPLQKNA